MQVRRFALPIVGAGCRHLLRSVFVKQKVALVICGAEWHLDVNAKWRCFHFWRTAQTIKLGQLCASVKTKEAVELFSFGAIFLLVLIMVCTIISTRNKSMHINIHPCSIPCCLRGKKKKFCTLRSGGAFAATSGTCRVTGYVCGAHARAANHCRQTRSAPVLISHFLQYVLCVYGFIIAANRKIWL